MIIFSRRLSVSLRRQQGSILVPAAAALLICAVLLGGLQLGYLIYAKRDMQKAADLAALTGAQILHTGEATECAPATTAASMAAQANTAGGVPAADMEVSCWRWDPVKNTIDPRHLAALQAGERYNAVSVAITRHLDSLVPFMNGQDLTVQSVAAKPGNPVAAFSIGTTLVATNNQPGSLISLLASAGVNLDGTALVGYDAGLANVKVTPSGLLKALGLSPSADISVADLNHLLATQVKLQDLLDAVVTAGAAAGEQQGLLNANVTLVNALEAQLKASDLNVTLGSETPGRGSTLFANITAPDGKSALDAGVNALDLISTAVGVVASGHALSSGTTISLGLLDVTTAARVVEPAQIAIGGVGTQAFSAQVRVFVEVAFDTSKLAVVNNLLPFLKFSIDLPIVVDVASATGTLMDLCTKQDPSGRDLATIQVQPSLLQTCIGDLNSSSAFSSSQVCGTGLGKKQLLTFMLGPLNLGMYDSISIDPIPVVGSSIDLYEQQVKTASIGTSALGDGITSALDQVMTKLLASTAQQGVPGQAGATSSQVASQLWSNAKALNPCDPDAPGSDGYSCRKALWKAALQTSSDASSGLNTYIQAQKIPGLLGGVTSLLSNLTSTLGNLLGAVTNQCAPLLGGGTTAGCLKEISSTLTNTPPASKPPNAVLVAVGGLLSALQPVLNKLGDGILDLAKNTLGLEINSTDVRLLSLQCNGKGVQLVY